MRCYGLHLRVTLLLATVLLSASGISIAQTASSERTGDPTIEGPYPVGVTTSIFVDGSRVDAVTKEPRTLVTEIWYPATDEARSLPKAKFSEFIPGGVTPMLRSLLKSAYKLSVEELDAKFWNSAVRDARVRKGTFPVVFFSHGNRGLRFQNTFWCDFLASHGYIVVSADHTGNAAVTVIKGKLVLYQASERERAAQDRPRDLSFLLDQMTIWNQGGDSRFAGRLDLTRAIAAGMSFGAYAAIRAGDLDPRFKAVIAMAYAPTEGHTNLTVPSLYMLGKEDATIGPKGNEAIRTNFAMHKGVALLMEITRGGHYSFTDMFKLDANFGDGVGTGKRKESGETITFTPMEVTYRMINAYSLAFLEYTIKGETRFLPFIRNNRWPDEMEWKASGLEAGPSSSR